MNTTRRELGDKLPFSGLLFGFFQFGVLVGCIPGHGSFAKASIVVFLCWASYHLITKTSTTDFAADLGIGSAILTQFLIALDNMYFTDPNSLKNHNDRHEGEITNQPFLKRARWALNIYTNSRGIGWAHEPQVLPKRPPSGTARWKFVFGRLATATFGVFLEFLVVVANASNPGLTTPGRTLSDAAFKWRVLGAVCFVLAGRARINGLHCVLSAAVVGLGFSRPERWPNMFGSLLDAWSIQNVWRVVWHQMLRKPLIRCTDFIITVILGLRPLSDKTNNKILDTSKWLLWLHILFFIVGAVHLGGEYMLLRRMGFGALKFFYLQAVGITLERSIIFVWSILSSDSNGDSPTCTIAQNGRSDNRNNPSKSPAMQNNLNNPRIWVRMIGYLWVIWWFTWTLSFMLEPMVSTGMFVDVRYDLRKNHWTSIVGL